MRPSVDSTWSQTKLGLLTAGEAVAAKCSAAGIIAPPGSPEVVTADWLAQFNLNDLLCSFYSMTEYFTNLILLLMNIFCCS